MVTIVQEITSFFLLNEYMTHMHDSNQSDSQEVHNEQHQTPKAEVQPKEQRQIWREASAHK